MIGIQRLRLLGCHAVRASRQLSALARAQYGGRYTITLLPGDGVGPDLMGHIKHIFKVAGIPIDFEEIKDTGSVENAILAIKRNGVALKGNFDSRPNLGSQNVSLREELDLFANIIHCQSFPGIPTRHGNLDIVIIRENTEGEYKQLEHEVFQEGVGGVVESMKIITEKNSMRIAEYAFEFAARNNRKKVSAIHKANIMKLTDGLFLDCCQKVAGRYPKLEFESMIVDNCCMQLVSKPSQFDVMVLPNLYGNIIANIGCGLMGGPGLIPGINLGDDFALFEMGTRNTGKNIAGMNIANPSAMIFASAEMLAHLGLKSYALLLKQSLMQVLNEDKVHTPDLGGSATTTEVIQALLGRMSENTNLSNK